MGIFILSTQTPEEIRIYQLVRTRAIRAENEANRTPEIRMLQKKEKELEMKWQKTISRVIRTKIKEQYMEVVDLLMSKVKHPPGRFE